MARFKGFDYDRKLIDVRSALETSITLEQDTTHWIKHADRTLDTIIFDNMYWVQIFFPTQISHFRPGPNTQNYMGLPLTAADYGHTSTQHFEITYTHLMHGLELLGAFE